MAKRTTQPASQPGMDDELELGEELENASDAPAEEVVDDDDEDEQVVEEVQEEPQRTTQQQADQFIPIDRYNAERARVDSLTKILENLQAQQQPQRQTQQPVQEVDEYANYTREARDWIQFMAPVIRKEAEKIADAKLNAVVPNLQRDTIMTREMQSLELTRAKHKDYGAYEAEINEERAKWYSTTGQLPPPHETFYFFVKGRRAASDSATQRTATTRAAAKPGSQVATKPTVKKVAPKGPLSIEEFDAMTEKQQEEAMVKLGVRF